MRNLVSCVCPTYARPAFLLEAVRQFKAQTWANAELIIVDDSPTKLRATVPASPRIKLVRLSERRTMGAKHNQALAMAQGDLICHWDDDDWQSPRRLVKQVEALVLDKGDVCGFNVDTLLTTGDARFWRFDRNHIPNKALVGNATVRVSVPFMDGSAMFKRTAVGDARYPDVAVGQKVVFLDQMRQRGARFRTLPNDGMYVYVRHRPGSSAVNTWQYWGDRKLTPIPTPSWFPTPQLEFYRSVA